MGTRDNRSHAVQSATADNREDFNTLSASSCGLRVQGRSPAFSDGIDANKKFLKVRTMPKSEARDVASGYGEELAVVMVRSCQWLWLGVGSGYGEELAVVMVRNWQWLW